MSPKLHVKLDDLFETVRDGWSEAMEASPTHEPWSSRYGSKIKPTTRTLKVMNNLGPLRKRMLALGWSL